MPLPLAMLRPNKEAFDFSEVPIVTNVGKPSTTYHANKQLLCESSEYFRVALGPRWVEGQSGVVDMPDDHASAFKVYLNWIQRGIIFMDIDEEEEDDMKETWRLVIVAYALGDKLLDIDFKDAITDVAAHIHMLEPAL